MFFLRKNTWNLKSRRSLKSRTLKKYQDLRSKPQILKFFRTEGAGLPECAGAVVRPRKKGMRKGMRKTVKSRYAPPKAGWRILPRRPAHSARPAPKPAPFRIPGAPLVALGRLVAIFCHVVGLLLCIVFRCFCWIDF